MSKIKSFVIMYNRFTWAKALCEFLSDNGCEVILMDNGSTYPPLLEWYEKCPYELHKMGNSHYNRGLWTGGVIDYYGDKNYILTDHDLDLSLVPADFVNKLFVGLENNTEVMKSGLSLKINDLPDNAYTKEVIAWEKKWWEKPTDKNGFYMADIDTTLALYDAERTKKFYKDGFFLAVRSPKPYVAKHLSWYNTPENITEEEIYYQEHIIGIRGHWNHRYKELLEND